MMRPYLWWMLLVSVMVLSVAVVVCRASPEQRAQQSTAAIMCGRCGGHPVAAVVYVGDGQFLTAHHCAETVGDVVHLRVRGSIYVATVVRVSAEHHLALLQVEPRELPLRTVRVAVEPQLGVGTRVFAVGCPSGVPLATVHGRISVLCWEQDNREDWPAQVVVLDMAAVPGMSGGGVYLQRNGRLVGICIGSNAQGTLCIVVRLQGVQAFLAEAT